MNLVVVVSKVKVTIASKEEDSNEEPFES